MILAGCLLMSVVVEVLGSVSPYWGPYLTCIVQLKTITVKLTVVTINMTNCNVLAVPQMRLMLHKASIKSCHRAGLANDRLGR